MDNGVDRYDVERIVEDRAIRLESYVEAELRTVREYIRAEADGLREAILSLRRTLEMRTGHLT